MKSLPLLLGIFSLVLLIHSGHSKSNGDAQNHCSRIRQHATLSGDLCHGFHNRYHIDLGSGGVQRYGQELVNFFNSQGKKHIPAIEVGNIMIRRARMLMRENNTFEDDGHISHHSKDCIRKNTDDLKRNTKCLRSNVKYLRKKAKDNGYGAISRTTSHRHHRKKGKKTSTKKSSKKKTKHDQQLEDVTKQDKAKSKKHRRRKPKTNSNSKEKARKEKEKAEKDEEEAKKLKEEEKRKEEEKKKAAAAAASAKPEFDFTNKNHYEVLGVARNATPDAIANAFQIMAEKTKPDTHPGEMYPKWYKHVIDAFEVLKDPTKKADYDKTLK